MADKGGARPGAGRKKGIPNKASAARQAAVAAGGITPLDYMLALMRDEAADLVRRDEMAKAAAPYVHPKLAALEHTIDASVTVEIVRFGQDQATE